MMTDFVHVCAQKRTMGANPPRFCCLQPHRDSAPHRFPQGTTMSLDEGVAERSGAQSCGSKTVADAGGQNSAEAPYLHGILVGERLPTTMQCDVANSSSPQSSRRWYKMTTRRVAFLHCSAARDSVCTMRRRQRASCFSISGDEEICGSEWSKWSLFSQSVTS